MTQWGVCCCIPLRFLFHKMQFCVIIKEKTGGKNRLLHGGQNMEYGIKINQKYLGIPVYAGRQEELLEIFLR